MTPQKMTYFQHKSLAIQEYIQYIQYIHQYIVYTINTAVYRVYPMYFFQESILTEALHDTPTFEVP